MNPYCAEFNLGIYPLKDNFDPFTLPRIVHQRLDVNTYLNPEISKLLNPLGIYISYIETFSHWQLYQPTNIHVDFAISDVSKLNWIFGGSDSSNQWFQLKSQAHGTKTITQANTGSITYNSDKVEKLLYNYPARKNSFIFQAGIPHKACIGKEKRCCISMIPKWIDNNKTLTFQEAINALSDYLI